MAADWTADWTQVRITRKRRTTTAKQAATDLHLTIHTVQLFLFYCYVGSQTNKKGLAATTAARKRGDPLCLGNWTRSTCSGGKLSACITVTAATRTTMTTTNSPCWARGGVIVDGGASGSRRGCTRLAPRRHAEPPASQSSFARECWRLGVEVAVEGTTGRGTGWFPQLHRDTQSFSETNASLGRPISHSLTKKKNNNNRPDPTTRRTRVTARNTSKQLEKWSCSFLG